MYAGINVFMFFIHLSFRSPELVFVDLIDTRNEAVVVVNDVIRNLVIQDEELKPVLPKVR